MTPTETAETLKEFRNILILGHEGPDGDCLGSQLALNSFLLRQGKSTQLISAGPFQKPEIQHWQSHFQDHLPSADRIPKNSLAVLLDCSTLDRTGLKIESLGIPLMIIDHHASGSQDGDYRLVDPSSPSTTLLIQKVIEAWGVLPTQEEAELLFFGFATDTGYFKFLEDRSAEPFRMVARLVEYGVNPNRTFHQLTGGRELNAQKLVARIVNRTESHFQGRLLLTWETLKDYNELNLQTRDSGALYGILQSVKDSEVIVLIKEMEQAGKVSVSLRSTSDLNVGEIAQSLGGGGHPKASGCALEGSIKDARDLLLELFSRYFG